MLKIGSTIYPRQSGLYMFNAEFQFILLFLKRNCKPFCGYNKYMYNDYKFFSFKANECISVTQMWIIKGNLVNCFVQIQ